MSRTILTGTLRWTAEDDFFVETDGAGHWQLDLPWLMTDEVARMVQGQVIVEGSRTAVSTLSVSRITEVE